ncbi:hypothetical protein WG66_009686 [Moniliophthora roreri]|nr:hypothetical protein WG66_009686 [Moniliophthora roreri]KAI3614525.1 hypothetical protein WG66_009686 [Moniliophthora roreri]
MPPESPIHRSFSQYRDTLQVISFTREHLSRSVSALIVTTPCSSGPRPGFFLLYCCYTSACGLELSGYHDIAEFGFLSTLVSIQPFFALILNYELLGSTLIALKARDLNQN